MTIEFLVFSDHHAHNFAYGASRKPHPFLPGMYNSRLLESCAVLREIREYAIEHKIRTVLFGGDLFHQRGTVHVDALVATKHHLLDFVDNNIDVIAIPGNHDYADRNGSIHALSALSYIIGVHDTVECIHVDNKFAVVCVPYTDDRKLAQQWLGEAGAMADEVKDGWGLPSILLAHLGMQGAKVGSDYVLVHDSDISVDDVPYDKFTACLFGHFHQHQQLFKNGWFIGASHQHNWGDANTKRGFLHCKIDDEGKFSFTQIETKAARRFYRIASSDLKNYDIRPNDYVTLTDVSCESVARRLTVQLSLENPIVLSSSIQEDLDNEEMKLPSLNLQEYVSKWVSYKLNKQDDSLEKLGMSILSEALEEQL